MGVRILPDIDNLAIGNHDTAEGHQSGDDEGVDEGREYGIGRIGGDGLADTRVKQLVEDLYMC